MLKHFHREWADSKMPFNVLRDERVRGGLAEEKRIERKSTACYNTAFIKQHEKGRISFLLDFFI
jgi:hypothetical protein